MVEEHYSLNTDKKDDMRLLTLFLLGMILLVSCGEDPADILANSDDPNEINSALYTLGFDTTQAIPKGLEEGAMAPYFSGKDQNGRTIAISNLIKNGKVVVFFYRGYWCSICNRHLAHFQDSLSMITDLGAAIVAITPERAEYAERTILNNNLDFSVVSDESLEIMESYGVKYKVNNGGRYQEQIDWKKVNSDNVLPVPATYIIDEEGKIIKKFFNPDFRARASVNEIVKTLENI